jgi:hypothetical protein
VEDLVVEVATTTGVVKVAMATAEDLVATAEDLVATAEDLVAHPSVMKPHARDPGSTCRNGRRQHLRMIPRLLVTSPTRLVVPSHVMSRLHSSRSRKIVSHVRSPKQLLLKRLTKHEQSVHLGHVLTHSEVLSQ